MLPRLKTRLTVLHFIFAVPCIYVLARWLWPLAIPLWAAAPIAALLLIGAQYHLWSRLSSGSVFAPEFPRSVVILLNWGYAAILLLAVLQIVLDFGALATAAVSQRIVGIPDMARYGAALTAGVLAAIGTANALVVPQVTDVEVQIRGLPAAFDGYRLLQLTDFHISRMFPREWIDQVVDRANATGVDLIVITGDFIDGSVAIRKDDVAPIARLKAPDGVYAIPGNHEYYFDYPAWMRHLAGLGMRMLPNAHAVIRRGDTQLVLAGVTDPDAVNYAEAGPDLDAALAGAPAGAPILLLDHQPRAAETAAARGAAVQLSGHTHGGMVVGLDRLFALANGGFVSGRYEVGAMTLYVSNGTALWPGFAVRLGRPPEITRITLTAKPDI